MKPDITQLLPWQRFWVRDITKLDMGDYLPDPYTWPGLNDTFEFHQIAETPCLILLGLPGLGKSSTVAQMIQQYQENAEYVDLAEYGTDTALERALDRLTCVQRWKSASEDTVVPDCHLFLDGLDRARMRIDTIATVLSSYFVGLRDIRRDLKGLFVRLICRSAEVPVNLVTQLEQVWREKKEESIRVFHLAQLRRADVALAANRKIPDKAERFLKEVNTKNVVSLAVLPITLKMLIDIFSKHDNLPKQRTDTYLEGCKHLLLEHNLIYRESRSNTRPLIPIERCLEIAMHLATVGTLSNQSTLQAYGIETSDRLVVDNAFALPQRSDPQFMSQVREVLQTAMFAPSSDDTYRWTHISYAEFLTAYTLNQRGLTLTQLQAIVSEAVGSQRRVDIRLIEVAAWLAELRPDFLHWLMFIEPEIIIQRRHLVLPEANRAQLIDAVFTKYVENPFRFERLFYLELQHLEHSTITEQLRNFIGDGGLTVEAREFAIRIARACALTGLCAQLVEIALSENEPLSLQQAALYALRDLECTSEDMLQLRTILASDDYMRYSRSLRIAILEALWPCNISGDDYFRYFDTLAVAVDGDPLTRELMHTANIDRIVGPQFVAALEWVTRRQYSYDRVEVSTHVFVNSILTRAWDLIDDDAILHTFARALWHQARLGNELHDNFQFRHFREARDLNQELRDNHRKRHGVIRALVDYVPIELLRPESDFQMAIWKFYKDLPGVFRSDNFEWYVEQMKNEPDPTKHMIWLQLAEPYINPDDLDHLTSIFQLCNYERFSLRVKVVLRRHLFIRINSKHARKLQFWRQQEKDTHDRNAKMDATRNRLLQQFETWLNQSEASNTSWASLWGIINAPRTGFENWDLSNSIISTRIAEDQVALARVKASAIRFLKTYDPASNEVGDKRHTDYIGYLALIYCSDWLLEAELTIDEWRRWIQTIFSCCSHHVPKSLDSARNRALILAFAALGRDMWIGLSHAIGSGLENHDIFGILTVASNEDFAGLSMFLDTQLSMLSKDDHRLPLFIQFALENSNTARRAAKIAVDMVQDVSLPVSQRRHFLYALINHSATASWWDSLWPMLSTESIWFDESSPLVESRGECTYPRLLTVSQLKGLYSLAVTNIDYADDIDFSGGTVPPRYTLQNWRNNILQEVVNRGDETAIEFLQTVLPRYLNPKQAEYILYLAHEQFRLKKWAVLAPDQIVEILRNTDKTVLRDADQLLDKVIEFLIDIEDAISGDGSLQLNLWHQQRISTEWAPVGETAVSDILARELRQRLRGAFINREVEMRQKALQPNRGDSTDITVETVDASQNPISVIIEVKCSWHPAIRTFVADQLVNQYLENHLRCKHGLALVVHFESPHWDPADRGRRADTRKWHRASIEDNLKNQIAACEKCPPLTVKALVLEVPLK